MTSKLAACQQLPPFPDTVIESIISFKKFIVTRVMETDTEQKSTRMDNVQLQ
uniref:Uncharacterized protein n=1 Tax=Rhizophora mucronata TaxID=61149 RepID=A0A2P2NK81_RHIMU